MSGNQNNTNSQTEENIQLLVTSLNNATDSEIDKIFNQLFQIIQPESLDIMNQIHELIMDIYDINYESFDTYSRLYWSEKINNILSDYLDNFVEEKGKPQLQKQYKVAKNTGFDTKLMKQYKELNIFLTKGLEALLTSMYMEKMAQKFVNEATKILQQEEASLHQQ